MSKKSFKEKLRDLYISFINNLLKFGILFGIMVGIVAASLSIKFVINTELNQIETDKSHMEEVINEETSSNNIEFSGND